MKGSLNKVLIVDNDENICELIRMYIEGNGDKIKVIHDGRKVENAMVEYDPDIIILDIMLPGINGIDILKRIRKQSQVPVIILTAKGDTFDKVLALELGADDYILKPFEPKELLARMKAVMRRYSREEVHKGVIECGNIKIDIDSYKLIYKNKELKIPPKEFELLYYLASNKNKVFTREHLLCEVWGYDYPGDSRTVDVHIKRLREKVRGDSWSLETVWGVGYKFEVK
ncbi:MAG: response regulator transcription factor [Clostridium sp.]|nr:response regulator transcription factor [Clostridium sp.]